MLLAMDEGGFVRRSKAFTIVRASLSKMQSRIPMSHANVISSSIALASTSRAPRGAFNFLLRVAATAPWWSQITTPTLASFC